LKPQKNRAGNRIYKKEDIALIRLIDHYVHGKHLSIQDAGEMIRHLKNEGLYERKIREITAQDEENHVPVTKGVSHQESKDIADEDEASIEEKEEMAEEESPQDRPAAETGAEHPVDESEITAAPSSEHDGEKEKHSHDEGLLFPAEDEAVADTADEPVAAGVENATEEPGLEKTDSRESDRIDKSEMRELLQKISANIRDIIDILNES
jgi:DNA-binding transcriptional MerR regulator